MFFWIAGVDQGGLVQSMIEGVSHSFFLVDLSDSSSAPAASAMITQGEWFACTMPLSVDASHDTMFDLQ